jgi:short-subunit dehydrogenase
MNQPGRGIVITGASVGLGAALAERYAAPGIALGLLGRDPGRLAEVAERCRARGARSVTTGAIDVEERARLAAWLADFDAAQTIDLLIANAGVFTGHGADGAMETADEIAWMLRVNLEGVVNTIGGALPMMRQRRRGRIAIVSSLAALQPLADAPGYSASKTGVMGYGEALREFLIPDNVGVSLIFPGHIETAQVSHHVGALPLLLTADAAALRIKRGLDRNRSFIAFPRRLLWLIRAGRLVPWRVRATLGRDFRFHVKKT